MVEPLDPSILRDLPTAHAVALRLEARGAATTEIADTLGLATDAVDGLLAVAHAKLAEIAGPVTPRHDGGLA